MRICLLGDYSNSMLDEGIKNVSFQVHKKLQNSEEVLFFDVKNLFNFNIWEKMRKFKPQVIHYIPGPSLFSFLIAKIASTYSGGAAIIISAYHPGRLWPMKLIPLLNIKPELILTASKNTEVVFRNLGCNVRFLEPGVDVERFVPVSNSRKMLLRRKYNIDEEKFVVLHVGHLKYERNVQEIKFLQNEETQVIIVGSSSTKHNDYLCKNLEECGCIVFRKYLPEIQEIYALSDCYIFPTKNRLASIDPPLSILEAMSCNLPVVSTRFGAIPALFQESNGFRFFEATQDLCDIVEDLRACPKIDNRKLVFPYSWENICSKLETIYEEIGG
jgi:glycosyltransferase involved in cell wall biosynthesis